MKFNIEFRDDDDHVTIDLNALWDVAFPHALFPQSFKDQLDQLVGFSPDLTRDESVIKDISHATHRLNYDDTPVAFPSYPRTSRWISYDALVDPVPGLPLMAMIISRYPNYHPDAEYSEEVQDFPIMIAKLNEILAERRLLSVLQFLHQINTLNQFSGDDGPIALVACEMVTHPKKDDPTNTLTGHRGFCLVYRLNAHFILQIELRVPG